MQEEKKSKKLNFYLKTFPQRKLQVQLVSWVVFQTCVKK